MNAGWSVHEVRSVAELQGFADEWDDLWRRSSNYNPAARAEPLAWWLATFASRDAFRAVIVRFNGRAVAAMPLVIQRCARYVPVASLPGNQWSSAGDLLVDCGSRDVAHEAVAQLLHACRKGPYAWLNLQNVKISCPAWRLLRRVAQRQGVLLQQRLTIEVGTVQIAPTWSEYEASRSRNHRQQLRRVARRLERVGGYHLRVVRNPAAGEIEPLLRRGFSVEDRSWKGEQGSSVLRSAGIFDFYTQQAQALSRLEHLELVFLEHRGEPIAFEYGWYSEGVYYSPKVGYDPAFARYCPGQLLRWERLRQMHAEGGYCRFDFFGPISPATSRWSTHRYRLATLRIAARGLLAPWGRWALELAAKRPARLYSAQQTA